MSLSRSAGFATPSNAPTGRTCAQPVAKIKRARAPAREEMHSAFVWQIALPCGHYLQWESQFIQIGLPYIVCAATPGSEHPDYTFHRTDKLTFVFALKSTAQIGVHARKFFKHFAWTSHKVRRRPTTTSTESCLRQLQFTWSLVTIATHCPIRESCGTLSCRVATL